MLSKEDINALPLCAYSGPVHLVRTHEELDTALNTLFAERVLGFDIESRPSFVKGVIHKPALMQFATATAVFLVQLQEVPFGRALAQLLADPGIIKTGVGVREDMRALDKVYSFSPGGMVDLADIARSKGMEAHGLRNLAANVLGMRISKGAQCSNWASGELSKYQIRYAATDAWIGRTLYCVMVDKALVTSFQEVACPRRSRAAQ